MEKIYIVGGFVRDRLLGLAENDIDRVVVGTTVERMNDRFGHNSVGAAFNVWLDTDNNEWAMARKERSTGLTTQEFEVVVDGVTLEEDLSRRDFTINAMAIDESNPSVIIDPFNGQRDLKHKLLRHVSDAFIEDPLRVLRAARFLAKFSDFTIHYETFELCKQMVNDRMLQTVSPERLWVETVKALGYTHSARYFKFLTDIGFIPPSLNNYDYARLNRAIVKTQSWVDMGLTSNIELVRYAALNSFNVLDEYFNPPKDFIYVSKISTSIIKETLIGANHLMQTCKDVGLWGNRKDMYNYAHSAAGESVTQHILTVIYNHTKDIVIDLPPSREYGIELERRRFEVVSKVLNGEIV